MNNIQNEEIDRILILKHERREMSNGSKYDSIIKAKVSKTTFVLDSRFGETKQITFKKRSDGSLDITGKKISQTTQKCSLGHDHIVAKKEDEYSFFELPNETVESFVEWIQTGTWREVMRKDPPEIKLLTEIRTFFDAVPKDSILKPAAQKYKFKIDQVLQPWVTDMLKSQKSE